MNALGARIASLIAAQGPLSVAQFMALALGDPAGGYYATRDPFGRAGDFVTAPEISQMFGELLALWLVQVWRDQDSPSPARLIEFGPGRGTLMADVLRTIAKAAPDFAAAIDVVLIETSPILRQRQRETLANAAPSIQWRSAFSEDLADRPLFVLANEFFDALPIRQYALGEKGWCERMVTADQGGALAFALAPVPAKGLIVPAGRGAPAPGAIYETCPAGTALAEELAAAIARRGGGALIVDYGYGSEAGFADTLQAVKAHAYAPVLAAPGEADLTAHVDFAALAAAARRGGAAPFGPLDQGTLLARLGLAERAARLARVHPATAADHDAAATRLMAPEQMGTLFKALAFMPEGAAPPPGF